MKKEYECKLCGHKGITKKLTKGSFIIELILWLLLILPGVIYSVWRLSTRENVCVNCGKSTHLIPITV